MDDLHRDADDLSETVDLSELVTNKAEKFLDPLVTLNGEERAYVDLTRLETLWFNTGTLCNIACLNCYIESSPKNDRLVYLTLEDVTSYLDEMDKLQTGTREIGLTGGEPFMNRDIIKIIDVILSRGYQLIVLTNAMRPMMRFQKELIALNETYGAQLTLRISVDHFLPELHEEERGKGSWKPMLDGLKWLSDHKFTIDIAGRTRWYENEDELRRGFDRFFKEHDIIIDAFSKKQLVLLPEMATKKSVPEITTKCWDILNIRPDDIMCSNSRMIVKHKGDERASVVACTLLPYDKRFQLGDTLAGSTKRVPLNHRFCSEFCVAGGGACSVKD